MPLAANDVKSELSYAALHAVAARSGYACEVTGRHSDGWGIDARICVQDRFPGAPLTEFTLDVQLKSTSTTPTIRNGRISYALRSDHYDKLRRTDIITPRLLCVLLLPEDEDEWLELTPENLICRRSLWWQSLWNAPEGNATSTTVYVPEEQLLTPVELRRIAELSSRQEWIEYHAAPGA